MCFVRSGLKSPSRVKRSNSNFELRQVVQRGRFDGNVLHLKGGICHNLGVAERDLSRNVREAAGKGIRHGIKCGGKEVWQ